jgi:predicted esterase
MRMVLMSALLLTALAFPIGAQDYSPPPPFPPTAETMKEIKTKTDRLGKAISFLRKQSVRDPALADVEIFHQAAVAIVEHQEFFQKDSGAVTLAVLDRGLLRAKFLSSGDTPWMNSVGYSVPRGYRSRLDGSVQPYAVTYPANYGKDPSKRWRVDVVLHGRDTSLTEVKFLNAYSGEKAAPADMQYVRIDIFGRGNNAYRWAGEVDVFEAIESFFNNERQAQRFRMADPSRMVLRGFSMGGAGTWHLGLHFPDRWCCIGPGAGFTTTHGYIKNLPEQLPTYQEACLRIYDAVDYAPNAFNVPVVAYSGEKDPQMQAAVNIEDRLKQLNIPMTHLVAPGLEHKFPSEWQAKANEHWSKFAAQGRPEYPPQVRFTTYTLKYSTNAWVEIMALERHYAATTVDAERTENGYTVHTKNVRTLHLALPEAITQNQLVIIDGQQLDAKPWANQQNGTMHLYMNKREGRWQTVLPQKLFVERQRVPQKMPGLQGPIDDAFTDEFLCVRGTGKPWHDATQKYADANLKRFQAEWSKYFRGQLPIKDDSDVTADDIAAKHLILFGDPSSNSLMAQVLDSLPLRWNYSEIVCAGNKYSANDHVPVMIYPSPLSGGRCVVLNSGHTFHAPEFRGTNALLYPRLGDWAVLKLAPTKDYPLAVEVPAAGLFDEYWKIAQK